MDLRMAMIANQYVYRWKNPVVISMVELVGDQILWTSNI